jgi:hypothetical protein
LARYAAERGLPAEPVRVPAIHAPLPVRQHPPSKTSERLARLQQDLIWCTAVETASSLAAWQNWQVGRARRSFSTRSALLHDAIRAQLAGQGRALYHALDRDFVRGYLADHAGDGVGRGIWRWIK